MRTSSPFTILSSVEAGPAAEGGDLPDGAPAGDATGSDAVAVGPIKASSLVRKAP